MLLLNVQLSLHLTYYCLYSLLYSYMYLFCYKQSLFVNKNLNRVFDLGFNWRRGWDSNPREIALKLISSQPRYDHFDTSPCRFCLLNFDVSFLLAILFWIKLLRGFYVSFSIEIYIKFFDLTTLT